MANDTVYGPVTPKFAQLDAHERHVNTFTIQPYFHLGGWEAFWRLKFAGWYPDFARFVVHLTDKRILVESYEFSANEGLVFKAMFALANAMGKLDPIWTAQHAASGIKGEEERAKEMLSKPPEWFPIAHTEIATVERQDFNNLIQKLVVKPFGRFMVKIAFRDPARQALVFVALAAQAGAFSLKCYNKEFIAAMGQILQRT